MDDEEEDMSQPISHLWGTSFRDVKYEDRATPIAAGQALTAVTAAPLILFVWWVPHWELSPSTKMNMLRFSENRPEEQAGVSVEAQIGRKLREIGDKFQQDHFMRHQRQNLPAWMRLTMALFGFLFPRQALVPRLRGEQR
uniref:Bcl-2-modifying factor-like n=1 Tax=Seriola dumerili TaxID=41447 RepID=A0A3B4UNJ0_SERDU